MLCVRWSLGEVLIMHALYWKCVGVRLGQHLPSHIDYMDQNLINNFRCEWYVCPQYPFVQSKFWIFNVSTYFPIYPPINTNMVHNTKTKHLVGQKSLRHPPHALPHMGRHTKKAPFAVVKMRVGGGGVTEYKLGYRIPGGVSLLWTWKWISKMNWNFVLGEYWI